VCVDPLSLSLRERLSSSLTDAHTCSHQDRRFVLETLVNGLQRMEYRGYDSAGLEIEGDDPMEPLIFKEVGKVRMLKEKAMNADIDMDKSYVSQTSIAHTRCVSLSLSPGRLVALLAQHADSPSLASLAAGLLTVSRRVRPLRPSTGARRRASADPLDLVAQSPTATRTSRTRARSSPSSTTASSPTVRPLLPEPRTS